MDYFYIVFAGILLGLYGAFFFFPSYFGECYGKIVKGYRKEMRKPE